MLCFFVGYTAAAWISWNNLRISKVSPRRLAAERRTRHALSAVIVRRDAAPPACSTGFFGSMSPPRSPGVWATFAVGPSFLEPAEWVCE